MPRFGVSLSLALLMLSHGVTIAAQADDAWGNVTFTIRYRGELPKAPEAGDAADALRPQVAVPRFQRAGEEATSPRPDAPLDIDKATGGLANVLVWLEGDLPTRIVHPDSLASRNKKLTVEIRNDQFVPRIVPMQLGQTIEFVNRDDHPHNLLLAPDRGLGPWPFNTSRRSQLASGATFAFQPPRLDVIPGSIHIQHHPEARGSFLIRGTSHTAVSNERGQVTIEKVPIGQRRLLVWHERAGFITLTKTTSNQVAWDNGRLVFAARPGNNDLGEIELAALQFEEPSPTPRDVVTAGPRAIAQRESTGELLLTFRWPADLPNLLASDDSLAINPLNRGLKNVLVWLEDDINVLTVGHAGQPIRPGTDALVWLPDNRVNTLQLTGDKISPRVLFTTTFEGLNLSYTNTGPRNFIATKGASMERPGCGISPEQFALADDAPTQLKVTSLYEPAKLSCPDDPETVCWVMVRDNPFGGVSDANGQLMIDAVPTGKRTLRVWHELCGFITSAKIGERQLRWDRGRMRINIEPTAHDLVIDLPRELFGR